MIEKIRSFHEIMLGNDALYRKRTSQASHWMQGQFRRQLIARIEARDDVRRKRDRVEVDLMLEVLLEDL